MFVRFRLYFGIPVFNICLIPLILMYWIGSSNELFSPEIKDVIKYFILASVIGSQLVWSYVMLTTDCPLCGEKALPTLADKLKQPSSSENVPTLLKPATFFIDKEFIAGYSHCVSCDGKIEFKEKVVEKAKQEA